MTDHTLFFYGTLMAPQILHRVIHGSPTPEKWQRDLLTFQPAVLHGYKRHRVRGADYPGIIMGEENLSGGAGAGVWGTVVSGLTDGDVYRLDLFEGSEYTKERVRVRVLRMETGEGKDDGRLREVLDGAGEGAEEGEEVDAVTYVYVAGRERLEDREWDFEEFKRDKLAWWVGADLSEL
ncbi:hypothetical protein BDV25DRAFT_172327 [Aspergillus avenaceus]|uniref:Putative gamma-glutamylcyclotransferase n=1 Tax=Aspergillus avenaceus TaxID=36643 RepID=A0A5N6TV65_ASPAV|nr:hypothetical protein BDV25DRAFT_172327 [Aspergillus avenaceus]